MIVPGGALKTAFVPVDTTGLKFALQLHPHDFPGPLATVREIVFFLYPNTPLPPDHGVLVYWQASVEQALGAPPRSTGFQLLGAISHDVPSSVFQTGWSENEEVLEVSKAGLPVTVSIGVSIESKQSIVNIGDAVDPQQNRLFVAEKIAADLFKFMQSFDTGAAGSSQMVVPNNIFDRWFKRFESRFRRDPNFFLRNDDT